MFFFNFEKKIKNILLICNSNILINNIFSEIFKIKYETTLKKGWVFEVIENSYYIVRIWIISEYNNERDYFFIDKNTFVIILKDNNIIKYIDKSKDIFLKEYDYIHQIFNIKKLKNLKILILIHHEKFIDEFLVNGSNGKVQGRIKLMEVDANCLLEEIYNN